MSKNAGDKVFGGTMVVEGSALMQVTACGDDSTLGKGILCTVHLYVIYVLNRMHVSTFPYHRAFVHCSVFS